MKPILLEMTAFGSYAEKTVIPFSDLRHNLYLITGDTGAGKTTIFDAIMFALYGVASGRERDKNDMLHCDRAPKSQDTVVRLTFSHNGREYKVERKLHFNASPKKKCFEQDAKFWEPDCDVLKGQKNVTSRCAELLGLNAEQFRKIIMLAQGEFREFLKADSEKKGDILDKLFDNSASLYFQTLLKETRKRLETSCQEIQSRLEAALGKESLELPDGEPRELYLPERADLLDNLTALTDADEARLYALRERLHAAQTRLNALHTRQGEAVAVNRQFDELETLRRQRDALAAQETEMRQRGEALGRADTALHKVSPLMEKLRTAREALDSTRQEIASLRRTLDEQKAALHLARERVEADAETQEKLQRIAAAMQRIELDMPRYQELETYQQERVTAEAAEAAAKREKDAQQTVCDTLAAEIQQLKDKLEQLEGAEGEVVRCEEAYQRARTRLDKLSGEHGIQAEVDAIRAMEKKLARADTDLIALTEKASGAAERYHDLYQRFLAGQAGLLADALRKEVRDAGTARCPVCGCEVSREHLPCFAASAETPTREAVDTAKRLAESAEKSRSDKQTEKDALFADIHAKKDALCRNARETLPDCESWERLVSGVYLSDAVRQAEAEKRDAETALQAARAREKEKSALKTRLPEKETALDEARERRNVSESAESEQKRRAYEAAAKADALLDTLKYPDSDTATQIKSALEDKRTALETEISEHADALKRAEKDCHTTAGTLEAKEKSALKLESDCAEALRNRDAVLQENGFASPEDAEAALRPVGEEDGETWLKNQRQELTAFDNRKANTETRIRELEAQTKEKRRIDADALTEEIRITAAACDAISAESANQEHLGRNHRKILDTARKAKRDLAKMEPARNRLERLALLAVGASGEGGRLSFARYVMGTIFREILEMANQRLEVMSGGRYALVHKMEAGRKNAAAGMEIEILDMATDQRRPSATLSGGEAFFTSLSLALGLSDVVQNRAGGRPMDALFIDEGFGTLSDGVLDKTLEALKRLTEGNRLVGVISHVDRLSESIPQKIRVTNGPKGSAVSLELS